MSISAVTNPLITLVGPTASGKTSLAAQIAYCYGGEIISADSRQVYRRMDLGTGKDYGDYIINGVTIPSHLLDICEPGEEYNLYRYLADFKEVYQNIQAQKKIAVLCGGTGLYVEAVLKGYNVVEIPENMVLRNELQHHTDEQLKDLLMSYGPVHATSDLSDRARLIKAVEQREYYRENEIPATMGGYPSPVFCLFYPRDIQRQRITQRLNQRMKEGMIKEVRSLIDEGVNVEQLISYGLEYKWVTYYLTGQCNYEKMMISLNTAIHQFAKRQMTWFRGMEKRGISVFWLDAGQPLEEKLKLIDETLNKATK